MKGWWTAGGLQGARTHQHLEPSSTWQDRTEGATGFAKLPTRCLDPLPSKLVWYKPTSSFHSCRGGISFAFSQLCEAPCCTSNAMQSHPQGFLTCPVLCPAAQAHPSRTHGSLILGATSASASCTPVRAPALECFSQRVSQGSSCSDTVMLQVI